MLLPRPRQSLAVEKKWPDYDYKGKNVQTFFKYWKNEASLNSQGESVAPSWAHKK
ncbi:hypothetical protein BJV82DRAFT_597519 [Fennellomyces sp. T-0311]|nr:hypothetical protein BJV82DRAFT_597519 [Fennellomyces sp. T-0311]